MFSFLACPECFLLTNKVFELCLCKSFLFTENGWFDNGGGMGPFVDVKEQMD